MPRVLKRPSAKTDLAEIWLLIADDSQEASDRFLGLIEEKLGLFATQPQMGRPRAEVMPSLRSFPVGNYIVFYLAITDGIEVLRVLHGARDLGVHDFEDDEADS